MIGTAQPGPDLVTHDDGSTLQPLLLHSLADMRELWLPLLTLADVRSVTEVGSESGVTTLLLLRHVEQQGGGRLVVVDPEPGVAPETTAEVTVDVVRGFSPEALEGLEPTDAYLLDGDHNYWTVIRELAAIEPADDQPYPLAVLNDVSWPAARRDQYYDPERLPADAVHPYSYERGVRLGQREAGTGGFRGAGSFAFALIEGGPRNGVLTAVEDFVAQRPHLTLYRMASVFGLGVIVDDRHGWAGDVAHALEPFDESSFLARLERNRIELYLRVLDLQEMGATELRARQRDWARLDEQRSALAVEQLALLERVAETERVAEQRAQAAEQAAVPPKRRLPAWPQRLR